MSLKIRVLYPGFCSELWTWNLLCHFDHHKCCCLKFDQQSLTLYHRASICVYYMMGMMWLVMQVHLWQLRLLYYYMLYCTVL